MNTDSSIKLDTNTSDLTQFNYEQETNLCLNHISVLFSHGPIAKKAFLVPDSCRATNRNGDSIISADITDDTIEND